MATAVFADTPTGYRRTIELFVWKKTLTEVDSTWVDGRKAGGEKTATEYAKRQEVEAAYEARCAALLAEGWYDRLVGGRKRYAPGLPVPKKASAAVVEAELDALSDELASALRSAAGGEAKERTAIRRALERYRAVRVSAGEPPEEFAMHFFAVDGVGLAKKRVPALQRLRVDAKTFARWSAILEVATAPKRKPAAPKKKRAAPKKKPAAPKKKRAAPKKKRAAPKKKPASPKKKPSGR